MGVKLEVFRMVLYLSFPVAMFWIANQAEYFEEYVVKKKSEFILYNFFCTVILHSTNTTQRELLPPDEEVRRKELQDFKERMRVRKEQQLLKQMSAQSEK